MSVFLTDVIWRACPHPRPPIDVVVLFFVKKAKFAPTQILPFCRGLSLEDSASLTQKNTGFLTKIIFVSRIADELVIDRIFLESMKRGRRLCLRRLVFLLLKAGRASRASRGVNLDFSFKGTIEESSNKAINAPPIGIWCAFKKPPIGGFRRKNQAALF